MIAHLAYAYVRLLLVLEAMLFAASLLLHVSVLAGATRPSGEYGLLLFRGTVVVGVAATPFIKDGLSWKEQIKRCPRWMWKAALTLGVYALFILCLQTIFTEDVPLLDRGALTVSGFPLAFDAISFCILYSVLRAGYLDKREIVRRVLISAIWIFLGVVTLLTYRAGYLRHPDSVGLGCALTPPLANSGKCARNKFSV